MAKGDGGRNSGGDRGGSSPDRSPNDDRSDVMNPNNDAYQSDQENRENQQGGSADDDSDE